MTTQNPPRKKPLAAAVAGATGTMQFAGFDDWFEIFTAGNQTDSKGRSKAFTEADLDSIVANHNAEDPAPLVVGHPKTNHPAWGWTSDLKREGDTLFAKAADVVSEFEDAVKAKQYRKRSVSIIPDGNGGFALRHIGFLGAKPPAVSGLADLAFSDSEDTTFYEFALDDAVRESAWGFDSIGRLMRGIRDWIIDSHDLETADKVLPDYQVNSIQQSANSMNEQLRNNNHSFSDTDDHPTTDGNQEIDDMPFTQQDLDDAAAAAKAQGEQDAEKRLRKEMQYNTAKNDAQTLISGLVKGGQLLPAQTEGLVEFMAELAGLEASFEFSSGEDTVEKSPYDFATALLSSLGKQIVLGDDDRELDDKDRREFSAPSGYTVNDERLELHKKAMNYAEEHGVDYEAALQKVAPNQ